MHAFHFDTVDSTNDAAQRLIADGRLRGRGYVLAREQTAGRGTQGRTWVSPRDAGIYLSIVRADAGPMTADTQRLTVAAGNACIEALTEVTGLATIRLKPINDLIVGERKLGGILAECAVESSTIKSLIVGIGINVRIVDRPLPAGAMPPISLEECMSPRGIDDPLFRRLVDRLVSQVDACVTRALRGPTAEVRPSWG
jgi:BirA family biotin operon repressor/biotin-[acetyl-CoA-carboxylase] ligase